MSTKRRLDRPAPSKNSDLRSKAQDPAAIRAEIDHFRQRIAALVEKDPAKAAILLAELIRSDEVRKKAA